MKAATLSPVPSAANQALIDKATAALQADYPALREYVAHRPQAKVLEPFLDYRPKPELPDADGRTPLCNAVRRLDIEGVLEILNHGADPNGRCEAYTMLGHVMLNNPNAKNAQRQAVTRILMSRGAEPSIDEVTFCGQAKYGDCSRILLPIVERRAQ
jgi:hypothetical protein